MKRNTGRIMMGLVLGAACLIFTTRTDATIIAGNGPTSNWAGDHATNPTEPTAAFGEMLTVPNSGGTLNNNWILKTISLDLFRRYNSLGADSPIDVYLIPGTVTQGATYVDNSANAVAWLTIPYANIPQSENIPGTSTPQTFNFTGFSDPQGVMAPGPYYLQIESPGADIYPYSWCYWDQYGTTGNLWYQNTYVSPDNFSTDPSTDVFFQLDGDPVNVPEPSAVALVGLGGLLCWRVRRNRGEKNSGGR